MICLLELVAPEEFVFEQHVARIDPLSLCVFVRVLACLIARLPAVFFVSLLVGLFVCVCVP